jgi:hypothetical protein
VDERAMPLRDLPDEGEPEGERVALTEFDERRSQIEAIRGDDEGQRAVLHAGDVRWERRRLAEPRVGAAAAAEARRRIYALSHRSGTRRRRARRRVRREGRWPRAAGGATRARRGAQRDSVRSTAGATAQTTVSRKARPRMSSAPPVGDAVDDGSVAAIKRDPGTAAITSDTPPPARSRSARGPQCATRRASPDARP